MHMLTQWRLPIFHPAAGSPSDVTDFIGGLAVPNVQTVSALKLQINPPDVSSN